MSDVGGAHRAVACNIGKALENYKGFSDLEFTVIDIYKESSRFCNFWLRRYAFIIDTFPWFYKWFYHFTDHYSVWNFIYIIFIYPWMRRKLKHVILEFKPDLIVSNFALSGRITVDILQNLGLYQVIPVIVIVVDLFNIHQSWAEPRACLTIVSSEEAQQQLIRRGVPKEKIQICGFAIGEPRSERNCIRTQLKFSTGLFTVMVMVGGEGSKCLYNIVRLLLQSRLPIQIIAIAGRNRKSQIQLQRMRHFPNLRIIGYSNEILNLMNISDVLITKAGPATLMEAFSLQLPVIITSWAPGQEEGNSKYVESKQLGYVIKKHCQIISILSDLMECPQKLKILRENIRKENINSGTEEIASLLMSRLVSGNETHSCE